MGTFAMTTSYYQVLFDGSIIFTHLSMIRMYLYLLVNDHRKNFDGFQWLEFLRIDEQTLIRKHFFTSKEAASFTRVVGLFRQFTRINEAVYFFGVLGIAVRTLAVAYWEIPFHWFVLGTVPNVVAFMFMTQNAYTLYNYYVSHAFLSTAYRQSKTANSSFNQL